MAYEPLHHKYRPQMFQHLVGQTAIATTLTNALQQQRIAPAYLFTGPRGTGKTSSARILAKSLNCLAGDRPTATPCGQCEACTSIARGSALDVIEIDAASNTGVDNIRELIERSQFAPVQCRYKVYVIDECITGDALVQTEQGVVPIRDPQLLGQRVLSYNEKTQAWEYKTVTRWLNRGERPILSIQTDHQKLRCTNNHLIHTDRGWIKAENLQVGDRILAPTPINEAKQTVAIPILAWGPTAAANSWQTYNPTQSLAWRTSLETVRSVSPAGQEQVYDLEVEDNHNFVANGLSVHNCHMLSTAAFNALLKTLEEPPDRVIFVLATTDPQRVLPTIISRCQRFDFRRIPLEAMVSHLQQIAQQEQIQITEAAITLVAQIAQGGLRDAESLLDQLSLLPPPVAPEAVWDLVGAVPERDLLALTEAIAANHPEQLIDVARRLMNRGREPLIVLQNLASFYRDLLIAKTAPQRGDLVAITADTWQEMCAFVQKLDLYTILQGQQHLRSSEVQLKNTTQPRLWLEVTLMGLLPTAQAAPAVQPLPPSSTIAPGSVTPAVYPALQTPVTPRVQAPAQTPEVQTPEVQTPVSTPIPTAVPTPIAPPPPPPVTPPLPSHPNPYPPAPVTTDPPPPVAEPTPTEDWNQLWQRVLNRLAAKSTRALLEQQVRLLSMQGSRAKISSPPGLRQMVDDRIDQVEEAFSQIMGYPVKIQVETLAKPGSHPSVAIPAPPVHAAPPVATPPIPTTPIPAPPSPAPPVTAPPVAPPASVPPQPLPPSPAPPTPTPVTSPNPSPPGPENTAPTPTQALNSA
ncbi:MAG: DNA polymerase III subunit gamma/tau, partial [Prochlorothrix sp.]